MEVLRPRRLAAELQQRLGGATNMLVVCNKGPPAPREETLSNSFFAAGGPRHPALEAALQQLAVVQTRMTTGMPLVASKNEHRARVRPRSKGGARAR